METTCSITLGIWKGNKLNRVKVDNISLDSDAESLQNEALSKGNFVTGVELMYRGLIFEKGRTLSSYGVTPGCTIHVLEKKVVAEVPKRHTLTDLEMQELVTIFKSFKSSRMSSSFRTALQRLSRPEVLENIIAATPGLAQDPVALAIIQDPELLIQIAQPETIASAENHPALIEAAHYIAAHIYDAQTNLNPNQASTSTGYSYSLDALSDDEDMEANSSDSNRESVPLSRNASFNAITSAQLAAAIANATNTAFSTNSAGADPAANTSSGSTPVITSEMFSSAMQQAFTSPFGMNSSVPFSPATPNVAEDQNLSSISTRWQAQLQQMREMGLMNDSVNIRALQATSGDVQAAVELVFNGVFNGGID